MKNRDHNLSKAIAPTIDKKDLVNLDFYGNEIKLMLKKLRTMRSHCTHKEDLEDIDELKHDLNVQRNKLIEFRSGYDMEEMNRHNKEEDNRQLNSSSVENFFQHLKVFEDSFKDVRERVNAFLQKKI